MNGSQRQRHEVAVDVGVSLWDNQKTDLVSGEGGKASQPTKFRPKSLNPTTQLPPVFKSPLKYLIYCLSSLVLGYLPGGGLTAGIRGEEVMGNSQTI